jgi:ABC-2 type transport system ATP-binding protein
LINAKDQIEAKTILAKMNLNLVETHNGHIECSDDIAINEPEKVATWLVNAGCPPTLLHVTEENLESYFFRTIGLNGGAL